VTDPVTGQVQEYRHLVKGPDKAVWEKSFANKLGCLAQGVASCDINVTGTIFFIPKEKVPSGRRVTYGRIVSSIRPQKTETHCTRLTAVLIIPVTSAHWCCWSPVSLKKQEFLGSNPDFFGIFRPEKAQIQPAQLPIQAPTHPSKTH
jgi:hypothetical protein